MKKSQWIDKWDKQYDPKEVITINIPKPYLDQIQIFIEMGLFKSRSQFIQMVVDKFLEREIEFKNSLDETAAHTKCNSSIVTVYIPKRANKVIADEFVTQYAGSRILYSSRSELVRVAIRDYLMEIFLTGPIPKPDPNIFVDKKGKQWFIEEAIENV